MLRQADVLHVNGVALWRSDVVLVGATKFFTTQETLTSVPGSRLAQLVSAPYPILDPDRDVHVMPSSLCSRADVFAVILEYLRGGDWPLIETIEPWKAVVLSCQKLGIPLPPEPYPTHRLRLQYEYMEVLLPRPPNGMMNSNNSDTSSIINSCAMISSLAYKGYRAVKELSVEDSSNGMAALRSSQDELLRASLGDQVFERLSEGAKERYRNKLRSASTVVQLERRRPLLPLVDAMGTMSSWFSSLGDV